MLIKKLGLNEIVFQKGKRKRHEILNIQQNTDILILFNWNEFEKGIFPLKLYEYLFSKNLKSALVTPLQLRILCASFAIFKTLR